MTEDCNTKTGGEITDEINRIERKRFQNRSSVEIDELMGEIKELRNKKYKLYMRGISMVEKRMIGLEDGRIIDCGVEEFEDLKKAIKEGNHVKVTNATVNLLLSSDKLMDDTVKEITGVFKKAGVL